MRDGEVSECTVGRQCFAGFELFHCIFPTAKRSDVAFCYKVEVREHHAFGQPCGAGGPEDDD